MLVIMDATARCTGSLLGLAVGDALGTTNEFRSPGSFTPLMGIVGGGPFGLKPGQWTDDTSMALCLADSLIARNGFDAKDQMDRYVRWWKHGENSVTGRCFDIGITTSSALGRYLRTSDPFSGDPDPQTAGNGSLMRLAPVVIFYRAEPKETAMHWAMESSRTTHAAPQALAACAEWAKLTSLALHGADKPAILAAADPAYVVPKAKVRGTGYVVRSLEAALWAFASTSSFAEGCLAAANLGDDADTVAAIYGQLAGAYYGEEGIPAEWLRVLAWADRIRDLAIQLARGPRPAEA
jgi:ADP-ribosyl-[dinitrogen reductase] hydrolase